MLEAREWPFSGSADAVCVPLELFVAVTPLLGRAPDALVLGNITASCARMVLFGIQNEGE